MELERSTFSIYIALTKKKADGLTFIQVKTLLPKLSPDELNSCLIWYEGLLDWCPVTDFQEFFRDPTERAFQKSQTHELEIPPELDEPLSLSLDLDEKPQTDRRKNQRFEKAFAVKYQYQGKTFETKTLNLSLGGMLLRGALPEGLMENFTARLIRRDGRTMDITCAMLETPTGYDPRRVVFVGVEHEHVLRHWLFDNVMV